MATFGVKGLEDLERQFSMMSTVPSEVAWKMLDAESDVVVDAQRESAERLLQGKYNKGAVKKSIKKGKIKLHKGAYTQYITYNGTQHGNRIAEIAFVNECGAPKRGIAARHWIRDANERCADKAVEAGADVLYGWADSLS